MTQLTINDCLYIILGVMCMWLLVQLLILAARRIRLERWRPGNKSIYYEIKNSEERCIVTASAMKEPDEDDRYYLEYKSVDTGYIVKRRIISASAYFKIKNHNVFNRKTSEIIFYAAAPNHTVLKYRLSSTNDGTEQFNRYTEESINEILIDKAKAYFLKVRPRKYIYKTQLDLRQYRKKMAYIETLPTVYGLLKRSRLKDVESKIRKPQKEGNDNK